MVVGKKLWLEKNVDQPKNWVRKLLVGQHFGGKNLLVGIYCDRKRIWLEKIMVGKSVGRKRICQKFFVVGKKNMVRKKKIVRKV